MCHQITVTDALAALVPLLRLGSAGSGGGESVFVVKIFKENKRTQSRLFVAAAQLEEHFVRVADELHIFVTCLAKERTRAKE